MEYVYILQSLGAFLYGHHRRFEGQASKHSSGAVTHTAKYRPWRIKSYVAFSSVSGTGLINLVRMARLLWGLAALVRCL